MFLRATYFRWARQIPQICPELMDAPRPLCIGDLHLENFGTWRDADGRLVWGASCRIVAPFTNPNATRRWSLSSGSEQKKSKSSEPVSEVKRDRGAAIEYKIQSAGGRKPVPDFALQLAERQASPQGAAA